MLLKSLKTGQFCNIKVASFKISDPDSLGVKIKKLGLIDFQSIPSYQLLGTTILAMEIGV